MVEKTKKISEFFSIKYDWEKHSLDINAGGIVLWLIIIVIAGILIYKFYQWK